MPEQNGAFSMQALFYRVDSSSSWYKTRGTSTIKHTAFEMTAMLLFREGSHRTPLTLFRTKVFADHVNTGNFGHQVYFI